MFLSPEEGTLVKLERGTEHVTTAHQRVLPHYTIFSDSAPSPTQLNTQSHKDKTMCQSPNAGPVTSKPCRHCVGVFPQGALLSLR